MRLVRAGVELALVLQADVDEALQQAMVTADQSVTASFYSRIVTEITTVTGPSSSLAPASVSDAFSI